MVEGSSLVICGWPVSAIPPERTTSMTSVYEDTLDRAVKWCRREYRKRRETEHCHESHTACDVLKEAESKFSLGTFGVEGWCDGGGREGVSYLNNGDSYDATICFHTWTERFYVQGWADSREMWDRKFGEDT
jgi:hypothetical protein